MRAATAIIAARLLSPALDRARRDPGDLASRGQSSARGLRLVDGCED